MSATSSIEWTDRTWNPVRGCSVISPGCVNCYAMKFAHRFSAEGKPYAGLTKQTKAGPQWTGVIRTVESALLEPLSWRKPQRVFVNSMSDLFHEGVPDAFIDRVFHTMQQAERHTFQVLTKRTDRMLAYARGMASLTGQERGARVLNSAGWSTRACEVSGDGFPWPLPNVWLGVSVEDQKHADERIPLLLQTPAAVRFVSAEPLLGPVNLNEIRVGGIGEEWDPYLTADALNRPRIFGPRLDWVIVGGESGPGARPFNVAWARNIVRQCQTAKVPVFVKQLGRDVRDRNDAGFLGDEPSHWPERIDILDRVEHDLDGTRDGYQGAPVRIHLDNKKGGDPQEWPADIRVRQFPEVRA